MSPLSIIGELDSDDDIESIEIIQMVAMSLVDMIEIQSIDAQQINRWSTLAVAKNDPLGLIKFC